MESRRPEKRGTALPDCELEAAPDVSDKRLLE